MHVTTVGLLLVVWPEIPWLPEIPGIPSYTDDWAGGRTGLRKWLLKSLQICTAPLRLVWRSFCRWQNDLLLAVFLIIASPIIVLVRLYTECKKLLKKSRKQTRDTTKGSLSTVQLETVYSGPSPGNSVLERLIAQDDIFYHLVEHAHAVDVLRLGLTSRTARAIVKQHWSTKACQKYLCKGSTAHCWGCDMITCSVGFFPIVVDHAL